MSNFDKQMQARTEGMVYALRIAKEKGIEELEKEIEFRGKTGISLNVDRKELNEASKKIKEMTVDTFTIMTLACLHDEFDFGQKRCQRLLDRIDKKADSILDDFATWGDYVEMIKDELGIDIKIRWNE
jgi:hypothetical protein